MCTLANDRLRRGKNGVSSYPVIALFYSFTGQYIYLAVQEVLQLTLQSSKGHQSPRRVRGKLDEQIDIAIRLKVIAQDRAEDGQLGDLPTLAEISQLRLRHAESLAERVVRLRMRG